LDFAQNGKFLLVIAPKSQGKGIQQDYKTVDYTLQAFSGQVENYNP
jgi:hypothetical protein